MGHTLEVQAVAVMPDGKRLITAGQDNRIMLWDAVRGRQLQCFQGDFEVGNPGFRCVALTPDGKRLLTGGNDNTVRLWDAVTGMNLLTIWVSTSNPSVAITPDGQRLVSGDRTGSATVWDVMVHPDIGASTVGLLSSPPSQGAFLAACALYPGRGNRLSEREILILKGHNRWVRSVAVSPDGQRLATASIDGTARVWDLVRGRATRALTGHTQAVSSLAVTPDGKRVVTGSNDGTARVWDTASGRELLRLEGSPGDFDEVAVTRDGKKIVTGGADGNVRVWDAVRGGKPLTFQAHASPISCIAVTPDGQRVVTGTWLGGSKVWDIGSGGERLELKGHFGTVTSVAVTPDGRRIVTGGWEGMTKVWDATSGRELSSLRTGPVRSLAITPDSRCVIVGLGSGTATVWDMAHSQELLSLQGHNDLVYSIAVTPDGQRIITGSRDRTVRVWDAATGRQLLILKGNTRPVRSVAVTLVGQQIITGSASGTVQIWGAATPAEVARWTRQEQEAARRLAAWQRPGPGAPSFIQDWLVLAPLALSGGETSAHGLEREQLPGEAGLQPRAGDHLSRGDQRILWKAHHAEEPVLDFNHFVGRRSDHSVAYAVCYVMSAAERNDLLLQVGSDDMAKVYLNGRVVYTSMVLRVLTTVDLIGPVTLRKGVNVLVLKVVNETGFWEGCARFVDQEGNPAKGLRFSLTPEGEARSNAEPTAQVTVNGDPEEERTSVQTGARFDASTRATFWATGVPNEACIDGLLSPPRAWVDIKLRELLKAAGYGREAPIAVQAVYIAPPDDRRKDRFHSHQAAVIRQPGAFEPGAELDHLVSRIKEVCQ
jgi:WD40 repeat protein